ncbi:GPI anchored serine-threonine rich family protein [Sporobolomyces salmoneus]|uniref:GPI anchored serine-threonine rich family protein n=1 Tax=Sporobolomyces salmoneus TaxID=183962 RepID=UPI00317BB28C
MHFLSTSIILAALTQAVLGSVYIVKPDGSDSFNAGKQITVTWLDNDSKPAATEFGPSTLKLATGSNTLHTNLATLAHIADPSKQLETPIEFDASWGPESDQYFILLESDSAKDPATNQPLQAFSARFQLNRMRGTFPPEALAQLSGSSVPASPSSTGQQPSSLLPAASSSAGTAASIASSTSPSASVSANKNAAASSTPKSATAENSAPRLGSFAVGGVVLAGFIGMIVA